MDNEYEKVSPEPLVLNTEHADDTHHRWIKHKNREWPLNEEDIPDAWYNEQCGQCQFYIPLQGALRADWGVCSNSTSSFDGKVMFEHDGCDSYVGANSWVTTYLYNKEQEDGPKE